MCILQVSVYLQSLDNITLKICIFLWCKSEIKEQIDFIDRDLIDWDLEKTKLFFFFNTESNVTTEIAGSELANAELQTHGN